MRRLLPIVVLLALAGCAQPPYWEVTKPDWMPERITITVVGSDIGKWCGGHPGILKGCASRDESTNTCHVYLRSKDNWRCNVRHEALRHCLGEDHPKYAYSMECAS